LRLGRFFPLILLCGLARAEEITVTGTVSIIHQVKSSTGSGEAVVWLMPDSDHATVAPEPKARIVQKNKQFIPHVVAVTVGTPIGFPNEDPFFHNVFSIYRGKPFDLGLYESGDSRAVRFNQPGVSYIFCNIHPEMTAIVVALRTPYFAVTKNDGSFAIDNVPSGRYKLEVFYDRSTEQELSAATRDVPIDQENSKLPPITLHASDTPKPHLNKYGEEYTAPKPTTY
jgi:plastocyanin